MTEPDGQHIEGYDAGTREQLIAEAADLVRAFGFTAHHIVLIGGMVPGLLVPVLDPGIAPHVGTADIDLCLSLALVVGDTESYERMETTLNRLGFTQGDASFRWHRRDGVKLTVEFFCPAGEDRPAGRAFRPNTASSPTAKHNMGGRLSALALNAGELLTADFEVIERTVELPQRKGTLDVRLRVTGPLAFLVANVEALNERDKPKDAYDIVWLIEVGQGDPLRPRLRSHNAPHLPETKSMSPCRQSGGHLKQPTASVREAMQGLSHTLQTRKHDLNGTPSARSPSS